MSIEIKFKPISQILDSIVNLFFKEGWFFFIPYLLFYLYFKYFKLEITPLYSIFIVLHIVNLVLLTYYLISIKKKPKITELLFWLALAFIFLRFRAYLEFPSDPWEHFRRIFSWSNYTIIDDNIAIKNKFTYYWGWTIMSNVQPLFRRIALDIYSTFWQLLLAYQFYLLAICLGFDKRWAKIQVVATIFLFGTNLFSFYRYYALSSTPLAYIAYLRSLIILINSIRNGQIKQLAFLIPLSLIMLFNHIQELLLLSISSIGLLWYYLCGIKKYKYKKIIYTVSLIIVIIAFLLGTYIIKNPQLIPSKFVYNFDLPYVSKLGVFRIWDLKLSYWETFGIHGLLSLILAIFLFNKYKLISILTINPYLLMLFPPFVIFFCIAHDVGMEDNYVTYRVLYAFPTSFMFVLGLKELINLLINKLKISIPQTQLFLSLTILLIIIMIPPNYPYRGRFWFQIYRPPAELSLKYLDSTAQWFFENRHLDSKCLLLTDAATGFMLATHFNIVLSDRLSPFNPSIILTNEEILKTYINTNGVCRLLIPNLQKIKPIPTSIVAQLSGHWNANIVNENLTVNPEFEKIADSLLLMNWSKTEVPPFYLLYENSN